MDIEIEIKDADANSAGLGVSRRLARFSIFSVFYKLVFLGPREGNVNAVLKKR